MKAISLALEALGLDKSRWETVLPAALTSTFLTLDRYQKHSHDRLQHFPRTSVTGTGLTESLCHTGNTFHITDASMPAKGDPHVEPVALVKTISPYFSRLKYVDDTIDTVSIDI